MTSNGIKNSSVDQIVIEVLDNPTPSKINLSTSEDVRREMAKVYREARLKKLAISDATKLSYILTQILKAHESIVLECRIQELERLAIKR